MFLLNLVLFFLGRFAFRIVFVLFGWVVGIFMGRTTARENVRIYGFTGISVLWSYVVLFGVRGILRILPEDDFLRMLVKCLLTAGILIFPVIGGVFLCGKKKRLPDYALSGLKGFFYCPIMSAAFVLMMIFGIIITVKRIFYSEAVLFLEFRTSMTEDELKTKIQTALVDFGGVSTEKAPLLYSLPVKILSLIREEDFCLKRETFLNGNYFRIFVNKDDLMIEGCKNRSQTVKIKLTEEFLAEEIYFAKGKESLETEKRIFRSYKMWQKGLSGPEQCLHLLDDMKTCMESALFEDWEILMLRIYMCRERIREEGEEKCSEKK